MKPKPQEKCMAGSAIRRFNLVAIDSLFETAANRTVKRYREIGKSPKRPPTLRKKTTSPRVVVKTMAGGAK